MKVFLRKIASLVLLTLVLLCVFDVVYTYVYSHFPPRNKIQFLLQLKNKKIDYVFLGSSRVQNHIDTKLVERLTSKKALNLGVNGAKPDQVHLMLKMLVANKITVGKLFIQIDYNYNSKSSGSVVGPESLPYIRTVNVIKEDLSKNAEFTKNYYVPFYRYAVNDFRIGFRNFFMTAISKKNNQDFFDGYQPKFSEFKEINLKLPEKLKPNNPVVDKINAICKANNIEVIYFCAPFCSQLNSAKLTAELKKRIPSLYDFSREITNDSLFINCNHLNHEGAGQFTKIVVERCITKKNVKP